MIYFDNGATTFPKPESVIEAVADFMRSTGANPGRSGHRMALEASRVILQARMELAELFHIENPMRIAFVKNATEALNYGIQGFLQPGDHVISSAMEHNSVARPITALKERGVRHSFCRCDRDGFLDMEAFESAFDRDTKLVALAHASNVTGAVNDLERIGAICAEKGAVLLVDAAQSAGVFPIDVQAMNIGILCAPGHKGLYGPMGTGLIYLREDIALRPLLLGGTGSVSESLEHPLMMPDALEAGTENAPGIAGLLAGVRFVREKGIDVIRRQEQELTAYFIESLSDLPGVRFYGGEDLSRRSGVVSFNIGEIPSTEIARRLDQDYDIAVRSGLHCSALGHRTLGTEKQGVVRASFSCFNTKEEVDIFARALREMVGEGL